MSNRLCLGSTGRVLSSTRRRKEVLRRAVWVAPEILESRTLLSGAPVLGVHFGADYNNGAGGTLAPTDVAGVVPMTNWNSESGASGAATPVNNADGTSTGASVGWQTNDIWGSGGQDQFTGGDQALMQGYLDHNGGTAAATTASLGSGTLDGNGILLTGLTGGTYDVVVYSLRDGNGPTSQITVTGTNADTETINPTAGGSYVLGQNYTIFLGMHPQNGSLLITPDGVSSRVPMNGVELLQPATTGVSAPTGITATLGANGTTANLSFSAAGTNADQLQIQRAASASGPFTTIATLGRSNGTINYADNGLAPGQSYVYKVVALNSFNGGSQAASTTAGVNTPALQTPVLGVHFGSDYNNGAGGTLAPTDVAGVDPMSNWNSESGISGTAAINDAQGASNGASVSWQTNDVWGSGGQDQFTGGDQALMQGYLDHNGGTTAAPNKATTASLTSGALDGDGILLTGLTGGTYDVVVYSLRDGNGPTSQITVTGTNADTETINPTAGGSYVLGQNYTIFLGMHPQNGSLLITPDGVSFRVPMNGVELLQPATSAPAAPTNPTASVNGAAVTLNWTENGSGAAEYVVQRGTAQAGPFTSIATLGPSSTTSGTYTDSSVVAGNTYYYRVGAVNSFNGGTQANSNVTGPVVIAATNSTNPIGINFQSGNGAEFPLAPTAVAGAYPISHWNNETLANPPVQADGSKNSSGAITDSTGLVTNVTASWFANNPWSSGANDNFPAGPDHDLMEGYLDEWGFGAANGGSNNHSATAASLTAGTLDGQGVLLSNLNLSDYDVIIYSLGDGAGRLGTFTAIGSNSVSARNESEPSTTYVLGQNTAVLADVKPVDGKILITFDDTTVRNPINGIELMPIATSAPSAVTLAGTYDPANAAANLTWTGGTSNTLENLVQRAASADGPWTTVGAALPNATSFTDQIPLVGQNVYYRLVSTNSFNGGSNANSNVVGPFIVPAGSGAEAHYFPQAFWGGQPTVTQDVTTVNLTLAGGTPDASIRNFNNSMVFTGKIKAPEAGFYTFVSNTDDDGYLYVDGQLVSSDPGGHGARDATTLVPISLAANSTHDFVFLTNQGGGAEAAHLEWVTPSMAAANPTATPVLVPNTALTSASDAPSQPTALAVSGSAGSNSVDFTFTSDNNAVVRYLLQRSTDGADWATVGQTNPNSSFGPGTPNTSIPIEDATANPSTTYQYRVVAMNFDHTSTPSPAVTVTTASVTQGPGVEVRYYNGEIASQSSNQSPQDFAVNGVPAEFLSLDFQSVNQLFSASPDAVLYHDLPRVNAYGFSSVWTGQVVTDGAGMYTFVTNSSDDGYLFVNGQLVSSDPGIHALRDATTLTPVSLAANTAYNFVFIQQEVNNGLSATNEAGALLQWIEPGQTTPIQIPSVSGTSGGIQKLMSTPDKQTLDASGHLTEDASQSAAGGLTATGNAGGVTLTWTDQSLSELWFEVQRATSTGGPFTTIGRVGFNGTTFTDSTAVAGTHYSYRVRGANFDATGPFSNTADATAAAASQTVVGTSGNDTITIKKDATDATKDDVWVNAPTTGAPTTQVSNSQPIVINGGGGTDTLVIDSSAGQPIPTGATGLVLNQLTGGSFTLGGSLPTLDATHTVDVTNSTVNIPYTGTSILPAVQSELKNGSIFSSTAAGTSGKFAIADVDDGSQVSLSYRVVGDINGDSTVGFSDLLTLAQNYNKTGQDWGKGDLTYDGTVGFADLLALAQHYNQTAAAAPAAAAATPLAAQASDDLLPKKSRKS